MSVAAPPLTLGDELEVQRLQHRAARLRRAIGALEDRRIFRQRTDGEVPPALRAALADFQGELGDVERRLRVLEAA